MKTAEEWVKAYWADTNMPTMKFVSLIQKEAYNQAIDDAIENARIKSIDRNNVFIGLEIDKESILKLKKP